MERKVRKAMLGLRTSPRRWQEHLSNKLKEHGFIQDERDPCLFVNAELDICIGVHVDDMLAVGPSESMKKLLQELAMDMAMRWGMVTDKPQEFLGSFFVQDATRLQIRSFVRIRDTVVKGLWCWSTQGFQHTQFREGC